MSPINERIIVVIIKVRNPWWPDELGPAEADELVSVWHTSLVSQKKLLGDVKYFCWNGKYQHKPKSRILRFIGKLRPPRTGIGCTLKLNHCRTFGIDQLELDLIAVWVQRSTLFELAKLTNRRATGAELTDGGIGAGAADWVWTFYFETRIVNDDKPIFSFLKCVWLFKMATSILLFKLIKYLKSWLRSRISPITR